MKQHSTTHWLAAMALVGSAAPVWAQNGIPVTIQLPSISTFGVQTTVVVPDSGRGYLGGIRRVREGRTEAGAPGLNKLAPGFRNSSHGREVSSSGMDATATILDRNELDPFVPSGVASRRAARHSEDFAGLAIDHLRDRHVQPSRSSRALAKTDRTGTAISTRQPLPRAAAQPFAARRETFSVRDSSPPLRTQSGAVTIAGSSRRAVNHRSFPSTENRANHHGTVQSHERR